MMFARTGVQSEQNCSANNSDSHKLLQSSMDAVMAHYSENYSVIQERIDGWKHLNFYICLLVLFSLLAPVVKSQTFIVDQHNHGGSPVAVYRAQSDVHTVIPSRTIVRKIVSGEKHSYLLTCDVDQFIQINIEQRGSNVGVTLFGVDNQLILSLNTVDDTEGFERLPLLADVSGVYRLEIRSSGKESEAGGYEMNVAAPRRATQQDRDYAAAEMVLKDARRFVGEGTGRSKRSAIDKYRESLPLLRSSNNREREATVLSNIGFFYQTLGELKAALDFFNQSFALRKEIGDRRGQAISLNHLGYIHVALGEVQQGLDYYQQSLALERAEGSKREEAITLSNIGAVYQELGETERALDFYNRSLTLYKAVGGRPREALTLTSIGSIYFSRDENEKALEFYERAHALQQSLNIRSGVAYTRLQIGILHDKLGEKEKAFDYINQALGFGRKTGNRYTEAEALTVIGEVYFNAGDKQRALEHFTQSLALRQASSDRQGEARTLYWIARSERERGQLAVALANIEAALRIVEIVRGGIASQSLRASYFSTMQKFYDFYIDLLYELHLQNPSAGYDRTALRASESVRARGLLEVLREAHADIRRDVDHALIERERSLQQQLNASARAQSLLLSGEHTKEQAMSHTAELDALANDYEEIQTRIRKTNPRYAALTQPQTLTAKEIQQTLDSETLLLEYKLGEARSFLWAVTPTSLNIYELPGRTEVEKLARRFYEQLTARNDHPAGESVLQRRARLARVEAEYATTAMQMSRMLLAPVAAQLKTQRLFIVADGALQYLPFAALPKPGIEDNKIQYEQASISASQMVAHTSSHIAQPLITNHEIISLPSASVIAVLRRDLLGRRTAPKAIAVLADPVFDKDDARVRKPKANRRLIATPVSLATGRSEMSMPRLPFSRREADAILATVPAGDGMPALNFQASRATAISPELSQYRILHFATHGVLDSRRPELSAIVLSLVNEQGQPQNGFLRLNEIYNLDLPADLVMLSACQTGLGKEIRGEGLVGLTRGFMYAGAARVGTSLWKVDDAATAALMENFYREMLREGKSPAAALRAAQLNMLEQKRWQSPYYWAAFTMQGEWK